MEPNCKLQLFNFCLFLLIVILISGKECEGANHYCIQDNVLSFSMSSDTDQSETLLTNIRNRDRYLPSQRCQWEVRLRDLREPRQLLLQPRLGSMRRGVGVSSAAPDWLNCPTELTVTVEGSSFRRQWLYNDSLPKVPLVIPIIKSSQKVSVWFTTGASEPIADCNRVELSIRVAKKGYCARNMLLYDGRCHLVSDGPLQLRDLNGTGVALAAFSGLSKLRQFLHDNEHRQKRYPFIRPLDLSHYLRVGIFCCPDSERAFYWNRSEDGSCRNLDFKEE